MITRNEEAGKLINGTTSADKIENIAPNVTIIAGKGDDSVYTCKDNVTVDAGDGNDTVSNVSGSNVSIYGGAGDDELRNAYGDNVTIDAGSGNNYINNVEGANLLIRYSGGNDIISGLNTTTTLQIASGKMDSVIRSNGFHYLLTVDGNEITLESQATYHPDEKINIVNAKGKAIKYRIELGTKHDDRINNYDEGKKINLYEGDDYLYNGGASVSVNAGEGDDYLDNEGSNVTLNGGTGNNTLRNDAGQDVLFIYGGGNDSIGGFNSTSKLKIASGTMNSIILTDGQNYFLTVGENEITLTGDETFEKLKVGNILNSKGKKIKFKLKDININNSSHEKKINGTADRDKIENDGWNVTINAGDGKDTINNSGSDAKIFGEAGNDSIYNRGYGSTIDGGAGNDSIHNEYSAVINGGDGNDSIENYGGNVTILGGKGADSIYNNSSVVSINGGDGNDTIESSGDNVTIDGGAGNDSIFNYSDNVTILGGKGNDSIQNQGSNLTLNGGAGNDYIYNKEGGNVSLNGGAGNDIITNSGSNVSINGGAGNDTLTGNESDSNIFIYESGNDVITNYNYDDIIYLASGKIDSYSINDNDVIFHVGKGSLTLKDMKGRTVTVKDSSGKTTTEVYGSSAYSPQQVIKNLVKAWSQSRLWEKDKLDESIQLCSHFKSIQDVIDHMVADCEKAGNEDTFLRKYCGIILDNNDTGAITGWDTGGLTAKTKEDIVPETTKPLRLKDYTKASFVRNNVTFNIAENLDSLTTDGKRVLNGLYSWWGEESLKLIEESYGVQFNADNTINFYLVPKANYAGQTSWLEDAVRVNIYSDEPLEDSYYRGAGVDNVIAHEFTHVAQYTLMNTPIMPQFLQEGLADLTWGIDDERQMAIRMLADEPDMLKDYLDVDAYGTGGEFYYAAGYMFYRYLAKQASDNYNSSATHAWEDNASIVGTKKADLLTASGDNSTINAGAGNDTVSAYGDKMQVLGGAGHDIIYSKGTNITISAGTGNDYIWSEGTNVTIDGGTGNDDINIWDTKNALINYKVGDGNDSIYGFNETSKLSITGGSYSVESVDVSSDVTIHVGGNSIILYNVEGKTININDEKYFTPKWKLSGKTASYGKMIEVAGVKSVKGLSLNDDVVTVSQKSLNKSNVTINDDYKLALGENVTKSTVKKAWNLSDKTATLVQTTTAGYSLASNSIIYSKAGTKTLATIKGVKNKAGLSLKNDIITLKNSALESKATVSGNGYEFNFASDYKQATISGSNGADIITTRGKKLSVNAGKGNDSIKILGSATTVTAGAGNDTIISNGKSNLFVFTSGAGNNEIYNYGANDTIQIADKSKVTAKVEGWDVIFTVGKASITVEDAAYNKQKITLVDSTGKVISPISSNVYSTDTIINGKSVTLSADYYGDFDATGFTKIDASQTDSGIFIDTANKAGTLIGGAGNDIIYGNKSKNKLYGEAGNDELQGYSGNDSLWGGAGNDTLIGGLGADTFIYKPGEGIDKIMDYSFSEGDMIKILKADGSAGGIFDKATFKNNTLTLAINGGGSLIFDYVSKGDKFNINGTTYTVSGKTLK